MSPISNYKTETIGASVRGAPIIVSGFSTEPAEILIMSGLHGDEVEGVALNAMLFRELQKSPFKTKLLFLQIANPDAFALAQRWNANGVDLNRNFPTHDWKAEIKNPRYPPVRTGGSEPETQTLVSLVAANNFHTVIDLHSFSQTSVLPLNATADQRLDTVAQTMADEIGIPLISEQAGMGYSINGGFYTWCFEQRIHNVTIEIEKGLGQFAIADKFLKPVQKFIETIATLSN